MKFTFGGKFINFGFHFLFTLFKMNPKTGKFNTTITRRRVILWAFWMCLLLARTAVSAVRLYQCGSGSLKVKLKDGVVLLLFTLNLTIGISWHIFAYWKRKEIVNHFNQFTNLQEQIEVGRGSTFKNPWNYMERGIRIESGILALNAFLVLQVRLKRPDAVYALYSHLSLEKPTPALAFLCAFVDVYALVSVFHHVIFMCYIYLAYTTVAHSGLKILRTRPAGSDSFLEYRKYRLVNTLFNRCYAGQIIPAVLVICGISIVITSYVMIRTHDTMNYKTYMSFVMGFVLAMIGCSIFSFLPASLHNVTTSILESWSHSGKYLRKQDKLALKSLPSFGIQVGSLFVMKRTTPRTYVEVLFDATVNVLLGTS